MNTNFIVNDYILIWNLLFQASISETVYKLKQKIWNTYQKEYNAISKDKNLIIKDYKNFIPNDDTVYNILLGNKDYQDIKKRVEKLRIEIMKIWDKNKKETNNLIKSIIRIPMSDYNMFIVCEEMNILEQPYINSIIIGKEIKHNNSINILLQIGMCIIENNIKKYNKTEANIKKAILELAILNEYATRLTNRSCYQNGSISLINLKKQLYPYWLMYLGIPKENFSSYIQRDKIIFDVNKYAYEKELKKMNIEEFIDFCIRNKRYMIREGK